MPKTRSDYQRKNRERRKARLPMMIREAYSVTPQDARTAILGTSAVTVTRRIKAPQDLTLGEIAQFIRFGYEGADVILDVVNLYLKESAKD